MTAYIIIFLIVLALNMAAYLWAFKNQSDKLTDITYSLSFIVVTMYLWFTYPMNSGKIILGLMVILWALRLGGFLLYRITKMGKDDRFEDFRSSKSGFLKFWLLQTVSIWILALPVTEGLTSTNTLDIHLFACILFGFGLVLEALADFQKFSYKNQFGKNALITHGLYKYIRHPNYLGEIIMWVAIFWYVTPVLSGWQWLVLLSPVWIIILLIKISGIPLIEKGNSIRYKNNPDYREYVRNTRRLLPFIY
jgi:steroid 5-alpha reductase family enzyme